MTGVTQAAKIKELGVFRVEQEWPFWEFVRSDGVVYELDENELDHRQWLVEYFTEVGSLTYVVFNGTVDDLFSLFQLYEGKCKLENVYKLME